MVSTSFTSGVIYDMTILNVEMSPITTTTLMPDDANAASIEDAIKEILPTVDTVLMEESPVMPLTAVFKGTTGGAIIFERI